MSKNREKREDIGEEEKTEKAEKRRILGEKQQNKEEKSSTYSVVNSIR